MAYHADKLGNAGLEREREVKKAIDLLGGRLPKLLEGEARYIFVWVAERHLSGRLSIAPSKTSIWQCSNTMRHKRGLNGHGSRLKQTRNHTGRVVAERRGSSTQCRTNLTVHAVQGTAGQTRGALCESEASDPEQVGCATEFYK